MSREYSAPSTEESRAVETTSDEDSELADVAHNATPGAPSFRPARGLQNAHIQTVYGAFRPAAPTLRGTVQRRLTFPDGDTAIIHDDRPAEWNRGDHVVLLMHGMAGSHNSGYMARLAAKLTDRQIRVFRLDHRGCGAGRMLARHPYHAGRVRDVEAAIRMLERLCPGSLVSIAGFSLSGNLLLRYLGENAESVPISLFRAVAVCPPIDLLDCVEQLSQTRLGQQYDWYFARQLIRQIAATPLWRDDLPIARAKKPPRRIIDFDELFTAPAAGFDSAIQYYSESSAKSHLKKIRVHTSVLVAEDDPLVSAAPWQSAEISTNVNVCRTERGGHLGYIGRSGIDPDNRWMDWRVIEWLLN